LQANIEPPKLSRDEQRGRGALLQDICKGTKLKKVTNINDRSAPVLEKNLAGKPALQVPSSRAAAPRPPVSTASGRPQDDTDSGRASLPELPRMQRPSLPDLSRPNTTSSTGMKHSSSAPPPPPPGRRANAPPTPLPMHSNKAPAYNREKPLPPTPGQRLHPGREGPPAPPPVKPPPSPVNIRTGPSGQSLAPPPPPYRQPPGVPNGPSSPTNESAPELPQRHNSLHRKTPGPVRGLAPPPPTSASPSLLSNRPPPPARDPPSRGAAPPPPPPMIRNGARDAPPPPPPYRMHGSEPLNRGKPPPPPSRTPAGPPPPPPPPLRNGHRDSITTVRSFLDDFESKYSFHPVEDFPAPEEYKHFQRIYPSKTNRGDDNLCNTPHLSPCSPPKQGKKENGPPRSHTPKGRRLVFDNQLTVKSPSKREQAKIRQNKILPSVQKEQEIITNSEQKCPLEKDSAHLKLFKQEGTCYQQAKLVLNTAVPDRLPAREKEIDVIKNFLREHICGKKAGSLYLSGAPGTGKTACLSRILQDLKKEVKNFKTIVLNCMSLRNAQAVFPAIAQEICQEEVSRPAGKDMMKKLEKHMTAEKGPMIVLVLDEMDQLDSKGQDVLYTLFEWPWLSSSRLVLIGIANTLDLTDRILPRLEAKEKCKPQLLHFSPYTRNQIAAILQDRLNQVSGDQVLDNAAVQFCARKISAVSGDVRKALDVCRRAIEIVESDVKSQTILKPLSECKSSSQSLVPKRVGLTHISQVISEVDGNRMTLGQEGTKDSFPLQQKILVCSLLLLTKRLKIKEVTMGKLYEAYSNVCRKQQVAAVDQSECLSLSGLLESRGILGLKKNKETRFTKVSLKIDEKEIEHALKDRALIGNILATGLP
ncbi:Cell division control protein 6-like protein, partial [Sciurus carolinensis]|nr:Cell division control protein 6-like protein [Sciurus carolinensis]